jgi:hypothetical protein
MYKLLRCCLIFLCSSLLLVAQTTPREKPGANTADQKDIDPLALKVLKAVTDPIRDAKAFSFHTRAIRDSLGSNGQIISYFTSSDVTICRPDKLRVDFKGRGRNVQLYHEAGKTVLYAPEAKLYAEMTSTAKTLDDVLENLEERGLSLPGQNLLASDPYQTLVPHLKTGYVIGQVQMYDKTVHQLAFTEKDAEYQLWVTGEPNPRIQALQIIDMARSREPRVTIQFSDWNLNPQIQADTFSFNKPADAKQIDFLKFRTEER